MSTFSFDRNNRCRIEKDRDEDAKIVLDTYLVFGHLIKFLMQNVPKKCIFEEEALRQLPILFHLLLAVSY